MDRRRNRNRTYVPRPSDTARTQILSAVRAMLADDLLSGYGVTAKDLSARSGFTYSTLRNYLRCLVNNGDLQRVAIGIYALPSRA
ncbi:MAG: hypothetical protein K8U57_32960 [Planctomycetes bacterium]|nr:hypothetical protein [Planctomycetota bacterium]